ncbi:hypothetical protein, partial [Mariniblastus fucicola]|uniref:hypothetical protein n=1 Tax=Mariniblastus fucicola TaxID=980251 RepID=UPI001EE3D1A7
MSDTMGGTTIRQLGRPSRVGRFGSTLCYPAVSVTIPVSIEYASPIHLHYCPSLNRMQTRNLHV